MSKKRSSVLRVDPAFYDFVDNICKDEDLSQRQVTKHLLKRIKW